MVPNGWTLVKLGDVLKLGSGDTKPADLQKESSDDSPYPVYGGNNIMGYSSQKNSSDSVILIGRVGEYCGVTRYIDKACWITDNALYSKSVSSDIDKDYLVSKLKKFDLSRLRNKGGQPLISQKPIYGVKLPIPPLPEQRKIAKILSTWDKAISTTECLVGNSKQQKKALMQQLLTGKKRLLDDSGKPFDGEWEEVKLSDVVSTGRGFAFKSTQYSESGYKIVRVTNVDSSGKIDLSDCVYIPDETACEYKKYELYEKDVLLVMVGATAGKLGFVSKNTLPALLNQNMWSLRAKDSKRLCQLFLRHVIYQVVARYLLSQQGSARGFFTQKTFESVKFLIPPVFEQQKIASVLTNADKEIELLEQQLADLKQEKKALMQQLLTGKRRVLV